jgi:acetyl-CoA carboxylase biotin carboxyl carrier protein
VADAFRSLTEDEVRQIGLIIESLDRSTFDFLQLEFGDAKLTIGKGQPPPAMVASQQVSVAPPITTAQAASTVSIPPPVAPSTADVGDGRTKNAGRVDGMDIVAPLLGRFYSQSEPGAPPFVSVGTEVTEDTTVGLIEVMKTFNAVRAGVAGAVSEIYVQDSQLVEYGDVLFRVRPHKAA